MNKKTISHGLMITAIVIAAFIAAAFTPVKAYAKTSGDSPVQNIAKIDYENRTLRAGGTKIEDNEIPLAAVPYEDDSNMSIIRIIVAVSAVMSGIVIFEDLKDRRKG